MELNTNLPDFLLLTGPDKGRINFKDFADEAVAEHHGINAKTGWRGWALYLTFRATRVHGKDGKNLFFHTVSTKHWWSRNMQGTFSKEAFKTLLENLANRRPIPNRIQRQAVQPVEAPKIVVNPIITEKTSATSEPQWKYSDSFVRGELKAGNLRDDTPFSEQEIKAEIDANTAFTKDLALAYLRLKRYADKLGCILIPIRGPDSFFTAFAQGMTLMGTPRDARVYRDIVKEYADKTEEAWVKNELGLGYENWKQNIGKNLDFKGDEKVEGAILASELKVNLRVIDESSVQGVRSYSDKTLTKDPNYPKAVTLGYAGPYIYVLAPKTTQ